MNCPRCKSNKTAYDPSVLVYECLDCGKRWDDFTISWPTTPLKPKQAELTDDPVLYGEPLIGWRVWAYEAVNTRNVLFSGSPRTEWTPRKPLKAVHQNRAHYGGYIHHAPCKESPCDYHVPNVRPGCGIYGFNSKLHLFDQLRRENSGFPNNYYETIGSVYLWGRIIEHEHGYRAEYAYPRSLEYCEDSGVGRDLAKTYGIPYEEDKAWKLALQPEGSSRNRSSFPSPYVTRSSQYSPVWMIPYVNAPFPSPYLYPKPAPSGNLSVSSLQQAYEDMLAEINKPLFVNYGEKKTDVAEITAQSVLEPQKNAKAGGLAAIGRRLIFGKGVK